MFVVFFFIVNYISIIRVIYLLIEFLSTHIFRCLKYTNRMEKKDLSLMK